MNENANNNQDNNYTPYRASGNLNTTIGNPNIDVNDAMNINIQNVATNPIQPNDINTAEAISNSAPVNPNITNNSIGEDTSNNNNANSVSIKKTYVSNDDRPQKKKIAINLGTEFKIALIIIVVLLAFILLLPMITSFTGK